jgi:hypothetical protein
MPGIEYEIRVKGRVGATLLASFEGLDAKVEPAATVLRRNLDQASLHEVLERLRRFGLELVEVRQLKPDACATPPGAGRAEPAPPAVTAESGAS